MPDVTLSHCQSAPRIRKSIAQQAAAQLRNHAHFKGRALDLLFELNGDVLIIRGRVSSFYLKQLLQTALRDLESVSRIENRVDVASDGVSSVSPQTDHLST
jgi:hypothetical protein